MAEKGIVPVKLSLTEGDFYTLWAPSWREGGNEWQAFLGADDDLYVFNSPEELLVFLESDDKHDLTSHPEWKKFNSGDAARVVPDANAELDIIGAPALLADRPSYANVKTLSRIFAVMRSLGHVTAASPVTVFFSSHSVLSNVDRGSEHYSGPNGLGEWTSVGRAVATNWNGVVDALDEAITVKEVNSLFTEDAATRIQEAQAAVQAAREAEEQIAKEEAEKVDPYDNSPWATAGIDPIKVSIDGRTIYTLRTYLGGQPVFLGKFGEIFTFNSQKSLLRWLVEHDDHDLARASTWSDLMLGINAGETELLVHSDNVYSFNGLVKDINTSVDAVDTQQMARAYELMADTADWADDDSMNSYFLANPRMQDYISYMLGGSDTSGYVPHAPFNDHSESWRELEEMLIKRFSKF
ncbi:hypothetical protein [Corynebacterium glutamicum]|uniref:hypothetical protein n=1 Tax=Corynebacterium glutamicum TaxID=1718 RepID=UPI000744CC7C|nr:hypothetical protein [Corynebacterium glutamicum]ALZ99458.1 hypothetical protein APT58_04020 [Corynebacterium glutamicum]MDO5372791.1 hypothetical protein [Corynebacterium glutamicum]HJE10361.1 hypothetical protein [Corynebacterium glutamicum]